MKPRSLWSCLAILVFSGPVLAEPLFSGTKTGIWSHSTGGLSGSNSGVGTQTLFLGNNDSIGYSANSSFSAASNQPFRLGQLTLSNFGTSDIPDHSTLQVTLKFQSPGSLSVPVDIVTSFAMTSNGGLSASINQGATTTFNLNGSQYQLEILGFSSSNSWSNNATSILKAPMCEAASTNIWAEISPTDPSSCQTPEPSALALGVIGIGMVGLRRWRKNV